MADQTELDQDFKCSACKIQKHYSSFVLSLGSLPKFVLVDVGSTHCGPIFWQTLGKNPILVGYVVLGIGYGVSAHSKQLILVGIRYWVLKIRIRLPKAQ